uniref:Uncharacterized protein n=1 Tax=Octopus bimaculoides TaxID=37653 RepID=A0A0L8I0M0_OCTBM
MDEMPINISQDGFSFRLGLQIYKQHRCHCDTAAEIFDSRQSHAASLLTIFFIIQHDVDEPVLHHN